MKLIYILLVLSLPINIFNKKPKKVEAKPDNRTLAINYTNQASDKIDKNQGKEALTYIIKAIRTDSTLRKPYDLLYRVCLSNQLNVDSLNRYLYKAKRVFYPEPEICFYLAEIYKSNNVFKKAIPEYSQAIDLTNSFQGGKSKYILQCYTGRAFCNIKINAFKQAIIDYSLFLKDVPDDATMLVNRGVCYQKKGDVKSAIADWKKAQSLGSDVATDYLKRLKKK